MEWHAYSLPLGVGVSYAILGVRYPAPPEAASLGLRGRLTADAAAGCLHSKSFAAPSEAVLDAETPS